LSNGKHAGNWPRTLLAGAVVWLFIAGFLAVQLWPDLPHSALQWVFLVVLGPPLYVLGETFFGWLFSPEHGAAISRRRFSIKRIAVVLTIVLAAFAVSWWLSWLLTVR
jgi:hypothetical protein